MSPDRRSLKVKIDKALSTLTEEIKKPQTLNGVDRPRANALEHEAIYIMREVAAQF